MPPPTPPIVNDGRMIDGKPVRATAAIASSSVLTTADAGVSMPISVIASRNSCRSSATLIASTEAPISFTPYFVEDAVLGELDGEVERGLAADGRQQRVRPLALDDLARRRRR